MRNRAVTCCVRLFSLLVGQDDREPLVGDLLEEHALRSRTLGAASACMWILKQVCLSTPALIRARFARASWPSTLGIAMLAWLAIAVAETLVTRATEDWLSTADAYNPAAMFLTMPLVVGIACIATRVRRQAAFTLAMLMLLAVTLMTLTAREAMPVWFRIAYFVVGPAAVWMGARLQARFWPQL